MSFLKIGLSTRLIESETIPSVSKITIWLFPFFSKGPGIYNERVGPEL